MLHKLRNPPNLPKKFSANSRLPRKMQSMVSLILHVKHQTTYEDIPAARHCFPKGPADHLPPGPTTTHHPPKKAEEAPSWFTAEEAKRKRLQKKLGPRDGRAGTRFKDLRLQQANTPADQAHSRWRGALVVQAVGLKHPSACPLASLHGP